MHSRKYSIAALLLAGVFLITACAPAATGTPNSPAPGSIQINGAGSTFAQPVYDAWIYAYQSVDPSVSINYQGTGSGAGITAILDNTVDFSGSDALLSSSQYTQGKDLQMYPVMAGAIVPIYNIAFTGTPPANTPLILDGKTLAGIYMGTITLWNDPTIVALNPDLANYLPAEKITAVHRSDGSGTTELFTLALSAFSTSWTAGAGPSIQWPVDTAGNGIGGKGNPGVAAAVQNTPNSIGYVELSYALSNKIAYASMINRSGSLVVANADTLASAMNDFATNFSDKLTNTIVNAPGQTSWPIAGYTYIILHTSSVTDCSKELKLLQFIQWALTNPTAAQIATNLGFAVLPGSVQPTVLTALGQVTCNGTPVLQ